LPDFFPVISIDEKVRSSFAVNASMSAFEFLSASDVVMNDWAIQSFGQVSGFSPVQRDM
jgi:hypothetical protein